ncbi:hypothetical protein HDV01_003670 [Terramyces sp. JEL0728]|nr:hypothetical protein HDV01_003670 [Terramyces sp. JEL0728]
MVISKNDWIFSKIKQLPLEERQYQYRAIKFLSYLGNYFKKENATVAIACTIFHRYYARLGRLKPNSVYDVAAACLFLSSKFGDHMLKLSRLVEHCVALTKSESHKLSNEWKESILFHEEIITATLCFDFDVEIAHTPLKKLFDEVEIAKEEKQKIWYIVNDCFYSDICVRYAPRPLAIACIYTYFKATKKDLPKGKKAFWDIADEREEYIADIHSQIVDFYQNVHELQNEI